MQTFKEYNQQQPLRQISNFTNKVVKPQFGKDKTTIERSMKAVKAVGKLNLNWNKLTRNERQAIDQIVIGHGLKHVYDFTDHLIGSIKEHSLHEGRAWDWIKGTLYVTGAGALAVLAGAIAKTWTEIVIPAGEFLTGGLMAVAAIIIFRLVGLFSAGEIDARDYDAEPLIPWIGKDKK